MPHEGAGVAQGVPGFVPDPAGGDQRRDAGRTTPGTLPTWPGTENIATARSPGPSVGKKISVVFAAVVAAVTVECGEPGACESLEIWEFDGIDGVFDAAGSHLPERRSGPCPHRSAPLHMKYTGNPEHTTSIAPYTGRMSGATPSGAAPLC